MELVDIDSEQENPAEVLQMLGGAKVIIATAPNPKAISDRKSTRLNSSHVAISYAVFFMILLHSGSPLFPYTTLFRSLMCAGETTFGALKNSKARPGDLVAIHGIGGHRFRTGKSC